jgi:hypothetical protein
MFTNPAKNAASTERNGESALAQTENGKNSQR